MSSMWIMGILKHCPSLGKAAGVGLLWLLMRCISRLCGPLPTSLRIVPPLVSRCCLHRIKPVTKATNIAPPIWTPKAITLVQEETRGVTFMKVSKREGMTSE